MKYTSYELSQYVAAKVGYNEGYLFLKINIGGQSKCAKQNVKIKLHFNTK